MRTPESPGATPAWGPRLAALLVLTAFILAGWGLFRAWRTLPAAVEPPVPIVVTGADLTPEMRAQRLAELSLATRELRLLQLRLETQPEGSGRAAVDPPESAAELVRRLSRLEARVADPTTGVEDLYKDFVEIDELWSERIQALQVFLATPFDPLRGLRAPPFERELAGDLVGTPAADSYAALYGRVQKRAEALRARHLRRWEADLQDHAERVRRVSILRQEALGRLAALGLLPGLDDVDRWRRDVSLELGSYPDRKRGRFLLELGALQQRSGGEASLRVNALRETSLVLLALALAALAVLAAARADRMRRRLGVRMLSWTGAWVVGVLAERYLASSLAEALAPFPSLLACYSLYRLALAFLDALVTPTIDQVLSDRWPDEPPHGGRYLRLLGLLLLLRAVTLRFALALAGPGFLLLAATRLLDFLVPVLVWLGCFLRRDKIAALLERLVPPPLGPVLARLARGIGTAWVAAPLGAGLVLVFLLAQSLLLLAARRHEGGKRLAAGVLQRWLETLSRPEREVLSPLPAPYVQAFRALPLDPRPFWQSSAPRFLEALHRPLDDWLGGRGVDSVLAVHGPRGSGRSEVTRHLALHYGEKVTVVTLEPPTRITAEGDLLELVRAAFPGSAGESPEAVARGLRDLPPTLVLVPDLGRFYLATVGGFDAYRALQVLIRRCGPRMLWVLVASTRTWEFLRAGAAGDEFLTREVRIPRGSDSALRDLVLRHHAAGGLPYRFGEGVVQAARATPGVTTEDQYFQILWQLSGGLPAVALELWLASARLEQGGALRLGVPPRNPASLLASLPHVACFVLASVNRHDCMTLGEVVRATDLGERTVFLTCERLRDLGLLELLPDGQRMQVARRWLRDLDLFLKARNLADGR